MLEPGTRLVMQLHLLNASGQPRQFGAVTGRVVRAPGDPKGLSPVGVLLVNDDGIDIPPGGRGVAAGTECRPPAPLEHVFTIWPHMHLLGRRIEVTIGDQRAVDVPAWNFDDQKLYATNAAIAAGGLIKVRCTFENATDRQVRFGMGTNDEMCSAFVYYYPAREMPAICGERLDPGGN
jgi:hypothetical protein